MVPRRSADEVPGRSRRRSVGSNHGREPDLNSAGVRVSSQFHYYSSAGAAAELGYHPRPFRQSVADAWAWFVEHGYVRGKK